MSTTSIIRKSLKRSNRRMIEIVFPIIQNEIKYFRKGKFESVEGENDEHNKFLDRFACIDFIYHHFKDGKIYISSRCEYSREPRRRFAIRTRRENKDGSKGNETEYLKLMKLTEKGLIRPDFIFQANIVKHESIEIGLVRTDKLVSFINEFKQNLKEEKKEDKEDGSLAWFYYIHWDILKEHQVSFKSMEHSLPYNWEEKNGRKR